MVLLVHYCQHSVNEAVGSLLPKWLLAASFVVCGSRELGELHLARIRSLKPDFFRDEKLQDLEVAQPTLKPMLVFEGLWTQSDKNGNFPWNPRVLHLDILPFIEFDLSASLLLLGEASLLSPYDGSDGKKYGHIHNFSKHQRISGKEAQEPAKFPEQQLGSVGEAPENSPVALGKERVIGKGLLGKERVADSVTEESFTLDAAVSYVLIETGLAGDGIRKVIHQLIARDIKKLEVEPKQTAEAMIASWRRYDVMEVGYKLGPERFFGTGTWRKTEKEWRGNDKSTGPQNVPDDYVSVGEQRRRARDAQKVAQ